MASSTKNIWEAKDKVADSFSFNEKEYEVEKNHTYFLRLIRIYRINYVAITGIGVIFVERYSFYSILFYAILLIVFYLVFTYIYQPYYLKKHLIE